MIDLINEQQLILPGYELVPHVFDDRCQGRAANQILLQNQLNAPNRFVFLAGLGCSESAIAVAGIAPIIALPTVSWAATAAELSDRSQYPFFYRSVVPEKQHIEAALTLALDFRWKAVVLVKGMDTRFGHLSNVIVEFAPRLGILVLEQHSVIKPEDANQAVLRIVKLRARIVLVMAYEDTVQYIHCAAWHNNVTGLIMLTNRHSDGFWARPVVHESLTCDTDMLSQEAEFMVQIGSIGFRKDNKNLTCVQNMTSGDFEHWWNGYKSLTANDDPFSLWHPDAGHAADGVCMMALALRAVLFNGTTPSLLRSRDQTAFLKVNQALASLNFEGVSGRIAFPDRDSGDPSGVVQLWQVQKNNLLPVGVFGGERPDGNKTIAWSDEHPLTWPGNVTYPPTFFAACGPGREPTGVQCQPCKVGHSKQHNESIPCTKCIPGRFASGEGRTVCAPCPDGFVAGLEGSAECSMCPYWKTSDSDHIQCIFNNVRLVGEVAVHVLLVLSLTSFCTRWRRRVKILDLDLKDGRLMMTTVGGHKLFHSWRGGESTPVLLRGTGRRELDGKWMRARVVTSQTVELLEQDESSISAALATSRGYFMQPFWAECLDTEAFWCRAPMIVVATTLFLSAAITTEQSRLDWLHFLPDFLVGIVVGILHQCTRAAQQPRLQARLRKFRRELEELHPRPTASPRGPGRAVSLDKLQVFYAAFCDFIRQRDMHYVNSNLVMPLTQESKLSYADLIGPTEVQWFVSHSWTAVFKDFIDTLTKHAHSLQTDQADYWICTFSNNQWNIEDEIGAHILDSSFYLALQHRACLGTAMVVTDSSPPLERIWCLFEAATTCERSNVDEEFRGLFLCTPNGVLNSGMGDMDLAIQLARSLIHIDLRDAKYSYKEDRDKIMERVEAMEGGFNAINRYVRLGIRDALLQMHSSFEKDFNKVVFTLRASSAKLSSLLSDTADSYLPASADDFSIAFEEHVENEGPASRSEAVARTVRFVNPRLEGGMNGGLDLGSSAACGASRRAAFAGKRLSFGGGGAASAAGPVRDVHETCGKAEV